MENTEIVEKFYAALNGKMIVTFRGQVLRPLYVLTSDTPYPLACTDGREIFTFTEEGYNTVETDVVHCTDRLTFREPLNWDVGTKFISTDNGAYKIVGDISFEFKKRYVSQYRYMCVRTDPHPIRCEAFNEAGVSERGTVRAKDMQEEEDTHKWDIGISFSAGKEEEQHEYIVVADIRGYCRNKIVPEYRYMCIRLTGDPTYEAFNEEGISELGYVRIDENLPF